MTVKFLVAYVASDDGILLMDVLQIGDERWLVPEWLEWLDEQLQTPAIAIRLDQLPHQKTPHLGADITVNVSVPKAVLTGEALHVAGIPVEVVRGPSPRFGKIPIPSKH